MFMQFSDLVERLLAINEAGKGVGVGNFELPSDEKPMHVPQSYIRTSLEDEEGNKPEGVKRGYISTPQDLAEIKSTFNEIVTTLSHLDDKQTIGGPLVSILDKFYAAYYTNLSRQNEIRRSRLAVLQGIKNVKRDKGEDLLSHHHRQEAETYKKEEEGEKHKEMREAGERAVEQLREITYDCFSQLTYLLSKSPELLNAVEVLKRLQEFVRNADRSEATQLGKILQDFATKLKTHGIKSADFKAPLTVKTSLGSKLKSFEDMTPTADFKGIDDAIKKAFEAKNTGRAVYDVSTKSRLGADELFARLKNRILTLPGVDTSDREELANSLNTNERRARMIYDMLVKKYSGS